MDQTDVEMRMLHQWPWGHPEGSERGVRGGGGLGADRQGLILTGLRGRERVRGRGQLCTWGSACWGGGDWQGRA